LPFESLLFYFFSFLPFFLLLFDWSESEMNLSTVGKPKKKKKIEWKMKMRRQSFSRHITVCSEHFTVQKLTAKYTHEDSEGEKMYKIELGK
jgi:hypothetical protein